MTRHQFVDPAPQQWTACIAHHAKDPERPRTASHGLLCAGHHADLQRHLAELPAHLTDVEDALVRYGNGLSPKVTGTKEQPLPFTLAAERRDPHGDLTGEGGDPLLWTALNDAHGRMASWCLLVLEEHPSGLHSPVRALQSLADDLRAMSRFLLTHLDWVTAQPWVDDLLDETRTTTRELRATLSSTRSRKVPLGTCDRELYCDTSTHLVHACDGILTATVPVVDGGGAARIACPDCEVEHEPWHWAALGRRLRRGEDSWLTAAELSQLLRVPLKTVQRWALEDDWRSMDTRPRKYHQDDAQGSYEQRRLEETG